jgi:hypothetical protein
MSRFSNYVLAVNATKTWTNKQKPWVLAWAIAEQGENRYAINGMGELARWADNYHSLHQRPEMEIYYPCVYHRTNTNEKDNNYIDFASPQEEIEGLMRFLERYPYKGFRDHMGSFEELLRFITPAFCPDPNYVKRVLSFIPEAEEELKKIGWKPDEEPVTIPQPTLGYNIRNGLLYIGDKPVPFFETPYKSKWIKNEPLYFLFHFTANDNFDGQCKYFQKNGPMVSPHILIGDLGQAAQFVPFHIPAHHSGSSLWNNKTIGIEVQNLGCSRTAIGNNVIFVKWNGIRRIPKNKCLYANHQLEPNIYRWWPDFTPEEYATINAILPPIRAEYEPHYGRMSMTGHESVCAQKVDPGPNFHWNLIT